MQIEVHNPTRLPVMDYRQWVPLQGNLKDLSETNYGRLKNNLAKRGFRVPAFLWFNPADSKYYLMDGHQRHRVMTSENVQPFELPYVLIDALDLKTAKELLLEIASQYGRITQEGLDAFGFDLDLDALDINFDALPDFSFEGPEPEVTDDEPPAVDDENPPVSKPGELYQLGPHWLLCGDATKPGDVARLMGGATADLVFTDPPYNQGHGGGGLNAKRPGWAEHKGEGLNDFEPGAMFDVLDNVKFGSGYFFCNTRLVREYLTWAETFNGWDILIMGKNNPIPTKSNKFLSDIEYLIFVRREGAFFDDSLEYDNYRKVRMVNVQEREFGHPTEKQVTFIAPLLRISSPTGGRVLDLFGGSGTTLIAAAQTGRTCHLMEIDPRYCDVIRKRYYKHVTGSDESWESATGAPILNQSA